MKKFTLLFAALLCTGAWADLEALRQAEMEGQRQERAAAAKAQARAAAKEKARLEAIRAKEAKKEAKEERMYQDYMKDKKRDQEYEDLKREIEIENMRVELEEKRAMRKARAAKAEDFAKAELNNLDAHTDSIRAESEATRNMAKGQYDYLSKSGDAAIKHEEKK
ncbi:DUF5384 family protein [Campylobacter sp. JMF_08 NE1]|uniref:DUF5384 family protein n=1 Tax=Campylobacter sp. JMF_08 NE1 TaxID=2983821 RepID=UPI0022E9BDB6|nr:DUF5384 family protein [Campylobacter sp. JMF_08 NE1]MDA3047824.1 DUF5384 family protein [Campylobacter sp. JMF_08 NE1]